MGPHFEFRFVLQSAALLFCSLIGMPRAFSASEEESTDLEIAAAIDVFYQKNFNGMLTTTGRVFDVDNDVIELQWAEVSLRKSIEPLEARIDLAFGQMVDRVTIPTDPTKYAPQAYFIYSPTALPEFGIQIGKFYSWVGLETVRPMDNWNISRSLTFTYGQPYWLQGLIATYKVWPELLTAGFALVNGWDGAIAENDNKSETFGGYLETHWISGFKLRYDLISGTESASADQVRQVQNVNGTYFVNDLVSVAFDFTYGRQANTSSPTGSVYATWLGWALYGQMRPFKFVSLSLRYEEYDDRNGLTLNSFVSADPNKAQAIRSISVALAYEIDSMLEARLEYRADKSNVKGLYIASDGQPSDFDNTLAVEVFANF